MKLAASFYIRKKSPKLFVVTRNDVRGVANHLWNRLAELKVSVPQQLTWHKYIEEKVYLEELILLKWMENSLYLS